MLWVLSAHHLVTDLFGSYEKSLVEANNGERKGRELPLKITSRPPPELSIYPSAPWSAQSSFGQAAAAWHPRSPSAPRRDICPWPAGRRVGRGCEKEESMCPHVHSLCWFHTNLLVWKLQRF